MAQHKTACDGFQQFQVFISHCLPKAIHEEISILTVFTFFSSAHLARAEGSLTKGLVKKAKHGREKYDEHIIGLKESMLESLNQCFEESNQFLMGTLQVG